MKTKAEASEMNGGRVGVAWQYLANDMVEVTRLAIDAEELIKMKLSENVLLEWRKLWIKVPP